MFSSELVRRSSRSMTDQTRTGRKGTGRKGMRRIGILLLAAILPFVVSLSLSAQSPTAADQSNPVMASAVPGRARQAYDEGLRAEKAADWEAAFQAYQQAAALSPEDRVMQLRAQLARSALAQQRTEQAERQLVSGNPAL